MSIEKRFTITDPEGSSTWPASRHDVEAVSAEFRAQLDRAQPGDVLDDEGFSWERIA